MQQPNPITISSTILHTVAGASSKSEPVADSCTTRLSRSTWRHDFFLPYRHQLDVVSYQKNGAPGPINKGLVFYGIVNIA